MNPIDMINVEQELLLMKQEIIVDEDDTLLFNQCIGVQRSPNESMQSKQLDVHPKEEPKAEITLKRNSVDQFYYMHYNNQNIDITLRCNDTDPIPPQTSFNDNEPSKSPVNIFSKSKEELDSLIQTSSPSKYTCTICRNTYTKKCSLDLHVQASHLNIKYMCDICHKQFTRKGSLTKHVRSHAGLRPFQCEICLKWYQSSYVLSRHTRSHSGEKNYECEVCHKRFTQNHSLVKHKRSHTGERPYKCPICHKLFTETWILTRHLRNRTCERKMARNIARKILCNEFINSNNNEEDDDDDGKC